MLAILALGACDTTRSPTAVEAPAAPRFNTYPGPTGLTVTNSGGHPLISWNAATGATSYTVQLITFFAQNGQYLGRSFTFVANTTGASYLDATQDYTGVYECTAVDGEDKPYNFWYEYSVQAHYPDGSSSVDYSRHFAPIGWC
ncbi:MAG TPA: hypothetical protein VK399_17260 [Longimicrobiaceae bacterium]|nr:hypothetical protein [Longimicrobiaceae bacterium]